MILIVLLVCLVGLLAVYMFRHQTKTATPVLTGTFGHQRFLDLHNQHGDVVRVQADGRDKLLVRGTENVKRVLSSKDCDYMEGQWGKNDTLVNVTNLIQPFNPGTLFTTNGPVWKDGRGATKHCWTPKTASGMQELLREIARHVLEDIPRDETLDALEVAHDMTLLGVATFVLGLSYSDPTVVDLCAAYRSNLRECVEYYKVARPLGDAVFCPQDQPKIQKLLQQIVEARMEESEELVADNMLSSLIIYGNQSSVDHLVNTCANAIVAAAESSASGLAFCWWELATNPEVQRVLVDTPDDAFLTRCVNETFRVHAPASSVNRAAARDFEMSGEAVEEKTPVTVCVDAVHLDKNNWGADADKWNPDRFLTAPKAFTFLPFGAGPHACAGRHYATQMLKDFLAVTVEHRELTEPQPYGQNVQKHVNWPVDGIHLQMRSRDLTA